MCLTVEGGQVGSGFYVLATLEGGMKMFLPTFPAALRDGLALTSYRIVMIWSKNLWGLG